MQWNRTNNEATKNALRKSSPTTIEFLVIFPRTVALHLWSVHLANRSRRLYDLFKINPRHLPKSHRLTLRLLKCILSALMVWSRCGEKTTTASSSNVNQKERKNGSDSDGIYHRFLWLWASSDWPASDICIRTSFLSSTGSRVLHSQSSNVDKAYSLTWQNILSEDCCFPLFEPTKTQLLKQIFLKQIFLLWYR